jgi:hypothetical protein
LFGHLWVVELTYIYIFAFKFTLSCLQPDIVAIICHYLPLVSTMLAKMVEKFATGVVDTGGAP